MKLVRPHYLPVLLLLLSNFQIYGVLAHEQEKSNTYAEHFSGLDSEPAQLVTDFHRALQTGDAITVRKLLDEEVLIFEGGGVERSANEYASSHMQADMAFLKQMQIAILEHHVKVTGNTAISTSISTMQGHYKDKDINSKSMETLVLSRTDEQWRITHIHWSN
jgi:ketosteroid isomerase-like protein